MKEIKAKTIGFFAVAMAASCAFAAPHAKKAPFPTPSNVPELMTSFDGKKISTRDEWEKIRRPEILECFEKQSFGVRPASVADGKGVTYKVLSDVEILGGKAQKKIVEATYKGPCGQHSWLFVAVFPKNAKKVPAFLYFDVGRRGSMNSMAELEEYADRRWPAEKVVERGFATAYVFKTALAPDEKGKNFRVGIFPAAENPEERTAESWATISAWAWGNSRIYDWLAAQPEVDASKIAIMGHSRGGKTALWTGASDPRFALVYSIQSGCGGAKLNHVKLPQSEHIKQILKNFPYWFCGNYAKYINKEMSMPFDQHMLAALIAPRPLLISSATLDMWCGQEGEWWTAHLASPAWELYGKKGLVAEAYPAPESPQMDGSVAYFVRTGIHSVTMYEWDRVMEFAEKQGWKGVKR